MIVYNLRKKTFADGTVQYMYHEKAKVKDYEETRPRKKKGEGVSDRERSQAVSRKRAVQTVFDIAKSNIWDWFITLTFDPQKVNSFDYDECVKYIKRFTNWMTKHDFIYLLVPELHESGRYHFHGLVKGPMPHEEAFTPFGKPIFDKKGHRVYNIPIYEYGFTTAIKCYSQAATGYVAKYITKQDAVPEGKKRYWASRSCQRPKVDYYFCYIDSYVDIFNASDYKKRIEGPYGFCELLEIHGEGQA